MKNVLLLTALMICGALNAQLSFKTGNSDLEAELNIVNKNALADMTGFKRDMEAFHHVGATELNKLLNRVTHPAEAFLAIRIAEISKRPLGDVMRSYDSNKGKGWGAIAKDLGIKPGSPEFHALKGNYKGGPGGSGHGKSGGGKSGGGSSGHGNSGKGKPHK